MSKYFESWRKFGNHLGSVEHGSIALRIHQIEFKFRAQVASVEIFVTFLTSRQLAALHVRKMSDGSVST
jgi:hypothetical protein